MPTIAVSNQRRFSTVFFTGCLTFALFLLAGCHRSETSTTSAPTPPAIQFGTKISFGMGGGAEPYKARGWSQTEEKFTWTEGTSAQLRLPVAPSNDPISLKFKMAALTKAPDLPFQPVEVWINDRKIAEWQVGDTAEFVATVPTEISKLGGVWTIDIKTPKANSPKTLGVSADPRVLGVCCFDLELTKG